MDYSARWQRLQSAMQRERLDGIVYGSGANFQYLSGLQQNWQREHEPAEPDCLLALTASQPPLVVCMRHPDANPANLRIEAAASLQEAVALLRNYLNGQRVGVSSQAAAYLSELVGQALPGAVCPVAEEMGAELRQVKDADEVERIRKVVNLTDRVMAQVLPLIRPGITQPELQQQIAQAGLALGAQDVSFTPAALYVKSGTTPTAEPFVYPQDQGLVPGTSIAFDFGFVLDGYCSDFGRSFYCGPAPEHISGAYRTLQAGQCHLISQLRPGMRISQLYGILEAFLDEHGYGDRLRARLPDGTLGHQIGVGLHEDPWLRPTSERQLQPGMVMAIEPKLWFPGEYYLRVEDIVVITENGAEALTKFDRETFELPL
jgi:Xaa-Pro aminopeptidase